MKTIRYFSSIVALLLLAVASSCSDGDVIDNIADEATHTAIMTIDGGIRGFDDSRADAEGWSDGDKLYLNFSTNNGAVSGVATYNKSIDSWSVTYSGTLTEGTATKCEAYFFDGETSQNGSEVTFNALTAVFADKSAYYVCKDGAISLTAMLVPQTARFRFKGTPGTAFSVSGCESFAGFASQSLQQSSTEVAMQIADDGYSPYIYGFIAYGNSILVVRNGEWAYSRSMSSSNFASGKSGWFSLPTESSYAGWEKWEGNKKIITVNGVSFKMVLVEAGTFTMGATSEQTGAYRNESPAHQVTLTKDYYMGETEVTQALWYAVMGQKPTSDGDFQWTRDLGLGDNYPAYYISWYDCQEFITKLNQLTGLTFRLPTEAEWEYAARGGNKATTQTLYSGSNTIGDVAWYRDNSSSSTHIVAGKKANALGLYDMSGNVWEWCNDWYGSYSSGAQTDPTGPSGGSYRVLRGGSWSSVAAYCRVAYRSFDSVTYRDDFGMRLVLGEPLPETKPELEETKTVTANGVTFKMKLVEAGTFTMGATSEQTGAESDESPAHQVTLTKDYYIGETEVTQALWYAVMGQKPTSDGSQWESSYGLGDNYPAYYISWNDCQEFITKLNQLTGLTFRLPTEAEWEYAARGGNKATTQTLYSGSNTIGDVAWYRDNSSSSTHIVAGKKANALGLYDMSGNVWELCNDWYDSYSSGAQTDPTGPSSGSHRVLRGGSWFSSATYCRVANRSSNSVTGRNYNSGMRLALTAK
ncbi:MAG: formylglycine-generating enzyme family protein [Muribaculaceae bacterium]